MPEQDRNIQIKEPNAPATAAQMGFLHALAESGVVTPEEMAALGDSPTKQGASDLMNAHSDEEGFKAVQEARRAERAASRPQRTSEPKSQGDSGKAEYANMRVPAAFIHPHTYEAKDGRSFEKAFVHLPDGVNVNGIDLSGYSCDVFLNDRMKQQMLDGGMVTIGFKADEPVTVFTGKKGDPEHPYSRYEVKPWNLVKAVAANNRDFAAAKAAERAEAKEQSGVSLANEAKSSREASGALGQQRGEVTEVDLHGHPLL